MKQRRDLWPAPHPGAFIAFVVLCVIALAVVTVAALVMAMVG